MKSISIQGQKRENVGKVATRELRNAEKVPCVVYGDKDPIHFAVTEMVFKKLVYTPDAHTVVIELGDDKINAILQDIQFHPVTDRILHADFYQIHEDKEVTMNIPVRLNKGHSKGLMAGGSLQFNLRKLKVKALPADLPDMIKVDLTNIGIGDKVYITDLKEGNYTFLHPDNAVVAAIRVSRASIKTQDEDENDDAATTEETAETTETETTETEK
ncbi:MAG: 50S ribosomal protein L25/general stress protein Ctc [Flavobacteriales bacterium]